ncbi:hypothetical protein LR48_Vigan05g196600 [Vigna angularis]|uniref:Dienelactone hydrolase domain-containing protein n=1 Tax=Phaseolus angularis TaxID=3914 RepID=A0A0L9UNS2_PHAAN|nr:hypothetical protein LR48_Vigan05g196600 [Vigna angularis]
MVASGCFSNAPVLNASSGVGHVINVGGVNSYVTGSPLAVLAILLVSDVYGIQQSSSLPIIGVCVLIIQFNVYVISFLCLNSLFCLSVLLSSSNFTRSICFAGFKAPLLRKIADKVADNGYYVLVPDFLHGDPYDPKNVSRPTRVWLKDHEPGKSSEEAKSIIEALKRKNVSAVGVAGFCWGAKTVTNLAKTELIQASVLLHPSYIVVNDIRGVNVPIAILGAEHDSLSPPKLVKEFEEVLKAKPQVP